MSFKACLFPSKKLPSSLETAHLLVKYVFGLHCILITEGPKTKHPQCFLRFHIPYIPWQKGTLYMATTLDSVGTDIYFRSRWAHILSPSRTSSGWGGVSS
ncbi:hypothetical protein ILYODFUR_017386 [Ilyodon furcidens]|uniref:Uncharacterized protein n=1 Tax=Ilyodon furcidens TaxID=33524 RepID=A0ABV0UHU7_9TELE